MAKELTTVIVKQKMAAARNLNERANFASTKAKMEADIIELKVRLERETRYRCDFEFKINLL